MLTLEDASLQVATVTISAVILTLFFFGLHQTAWSDQWHRYKSYTIGVVSVVIVFAIVAIGAALNRDNPHPLFWLALLAFLFGGAALGSFAAEVRQVIRDSNPNTKRHMAGVEYLED